MEENEEKLQKKRIEKIISLMDDFSEIYDCKLKVTTYEQYNIETNKKGFVYQIEAIKPEETICIATTNKK